jgi:hypothetical protein
MRVKTLFYRRPWPGAAFADKSLQMTSHGRYAIAFVLMLLLAPCCGTSEAAAPLALHVQGNHLVDASGNFLRLHGVNRSGSEYMCVGGYSVFDGPVDTAAIAAIAAWHVNAVRVPLNEDCWLGINLPADNPYIGSAYQQAIVAFVQELNNAGLYVILDLHWNAPGTNIANQQQPMADLDHGPAFWSSVAATFKDFPGVIFDLYNEPFVSSWQCWRDGCTVSNSSGTWSTAGMTQLVAAVRAAGATQPVMLGGLQYASDLSQWLAFEPVDPAAGPPQLVASYHSYCGPPGTNTVAACQAELNSVESNWPVVLALAGSVPVVTGEFGEYDCATTYVAPYMAFADANGISYLGWAWNTYGCGTFPALITDYTGTPTAYGIGLKSHLGLLSSTHDTHDYNGDGKSDIAWRDTSGNAAVWLMNGATILLSASVGAADPNVWSIVGQRDFDGDGKADWLWHDTSGNVAIWFLDGGQITQSAAIGNASPAVWHIVGTGDFNGDGKGDILWQDKSGNVAMWLMKGAQIMQSAGVGAADSNVWSIAGTGDFNGDGNSDILWHDSSGNVAMWLLNGPQIIQSAAVGNASPSVWTIVGTGDFNGDSKSDILWRDTNGNVAMWLMNGPRVLQSAGIGWAPANWTIIETGDFNGDGTSDILWHDGSGNVAIWFMNGPQVIQSAVVGNASPSVWTMQSVNAD